jgi:hypothetical protein
MSRIFGMISSILDHLCGLIGAFAFSQFPVFLQQYVHRLEGHISELKLQTSIMRKAATMSDKTLEQYVQKFISSQDPDFSRQGEIMQGMVTRLQDLSQGLYELQTSTGVLKPFIFLRTYNHEIAWTTLDQFQPGLVLNLEGIAYAFGGLLLGILIYNVVIAILGGIYRAALQTRSISI